MKLYHTTNQAEAILRGGFRDSTGYYATMQEWTGVWLSDRPLDAGDIGWLGDEFLVLEIPEEVVKPYEWERLDMDDAPPLPEGAPFDVYREFLVPAELVNKYGPPELLEDD